MVVMFVRGCICDIYEVWNFNWIECVVFEGFVEYCVCGVKCVWLRGMRVYEEMFVCIFVCMVGLIC